MLQLLLLLAGPRYRRYSKHERICYEYSNSQADLSSAEGTGGDAGLGQKGGGNGNVSSAEKDEDVDDEEGKTCLSKCI